ncbi:MAG: hypothetical protein R3D29_06760 [Nitratireductor sp.]
MKTNLIKSVLLAAGVILAAGSLSTPANAGQGHVMRHGAQTHQQHPSQFRFQSRERHFRDRICQPGEAIHKARSLGLRHPGIDRVNRHVVVVSGRHRGHWARLVFDRTSRHCRIVDARGI